MRNQVHLPMCKSIANRVLVLQARGGIPLLSIGDDTPDDVRILHDALEELACANVGTIDVGNCGTAMRFLTAYCALTSRSVVLEGCKRMYERPIGQLVEVLRGLGAEIEYMGCEGYPPLRIGRMRKPLEASPRVVMMQPQSSQFVSSLLLMGVEVETDIRSPYIAMTEAFVRQFGNEDFVSSESIERDWSSAAFWYEWVALHGGELLLTGLHEDSCQGDKVVAELFMPLGVRSRYTEEGVWIRREGTIREELHVDFSACPDLYPALAICCEQLGARLIASGTSSLCIKESDRLRAVAEHKTYGDHRIAMALLAADLECDDSKCVAKSYPNFLNELNRVKERHERISAVVPSRGVNDEGKGKKYALQRLISQADTEFVWMMDDDILPAPWVCSSESMAGFKLPCVTGVNWDEIDLLILPLRMEVEEGRNANLLERLQMAEYAAIQGLTIVSAKRWRPVMCSGANMIVRRGRWLESYADLHPELASGDDMFLLESFKRRGLRIGASDDEGLTAVVRPIRTWKAFFRQRMRWAGKAPAYQDMDIILCGSIVLIANLLQILCPAVMLVKFPLEYKLIRQRDARISIWTALLLELVYPYYLLFSLVGGVLSTRRRSVARF